jgi:hypothetical protein
MGSSIHQSLGRAAWKLAREQHGVVTRRQLLDLGLTAQAIQHRITRGRLHRIDYGIYAVGRPQLTSHGRWMAAVLSCGSRAILSHRSAAALWGIGREGQDGIEVSVPFASPRERRRIVVYRRPKLRSTDVTTHKGIPVATPVLTLIGFASRVGRAELERAVNEADRLGLIDPESLYAALTVYPGYQGVGPLRAMLGDWKFRLTDSELERRFLPLAASAGLPPPLTQQKLNGFKVDFYWPNLRLVVETDGLRYHRTPAQQNRDRLRDQTHTAAGLTPLRFTHSQIRYEPQRVVAVLRTVAGRTGTRRDLIDMET